MADYRLLIPLISRWEGGISDDPRDRAAGNPAPGTKGPRGLPIHTNKGVIWPTFQALAPKIGLAPTVQNFLNLNDEQMGKFWKVGFWDQVRADEIKHNWLAFQLADMMWGSGYNAHLLIKKVLNNQFGKNLRLNTKMDDETIQAINSVNGRALYEAFVQARYNYLAGLRDYPIYGRGWNRRVRELDEFVKKLPEYSGGVGNIATAVAIGLVALGSFFF
jgi:lysozyme family protein